MASQTKKPTIELILDEIQHQINRVVLEGTEQKTIIMLCGIITKADDIPAAQIMRTYQKLVHWARMLTTPGWHEAKTQLLATAQELIYE